MTPFARFVLFACCAFIAPAVPAFAQNPVQTQQPDLDLSNMPLHMRISASRPEQPGDAAKAKSVEDAARKAMEPYKDYHRALADGFVIFRPNLKQRQYHITSAANARLAQQSFDPSKPTSLLYKPNGKGGYTLVGAMYTAPGYYTEDQINQRIPLSIAHWHQHTNFCKGPAGTPMSDYVGKGAKFGLMGSIHTKDACTAAGGVFLPRVFGWMVHVHPYDTDPKKVWAMDDDDMGHDTMGHDTMDHTEGMGDMPGMKMQ